LVHMISDTSSSLVICKAYLHVIARSEIPRFTRNKLHNPQVES